MKTSVNFKTGCGGSNCQSNSVYVELEALSSKIIDGLRLAALTCPDYGVLTVTSQADGTHKENSLHYKGRAWDLRTRYMLEEDKKTWKSNLEIALGDSWQVILEKDHMHIEYDPQ